MHTLYYREDFFASALHEAAHWCIAGAARRTQVDFGYWYIEEGRSSASQRAFEAVEYKPQALEWFFSRACAWPFRISVDNLDPHGGEIADTSDFCARVLAQALRWRDAGLPTRAGILYSALCAEFGTHTAARAQRFSLADLI